MVYLPGDVVCFEREQRIGTFIICQSLPPVVVKKQVSQKLRGFAYYDDGTYEITEVIAPDDLVDTDSRFYPKDVVDMIDWCYKLRLGLPIGSVVTIVDTNFEDLYFVSYKECTITGVSQVDGDTVYACRDNTTQEALDVFSADIDSVSYLPIRLP